MSSNLADLPLAGRWPPVLTSHDQGDFKFGRSTPRSAGRSTPVVLTSCGQDEFKFGRSTPRSADKIWQIYPPVLTSCGQDELKFGRSTPRSAGRSIPLVLTSCGQDEFKFGRSTPRSAGRSTPWYWHLVVKMSSNLADLPLDLLEGLPLGTDILWSRWVQIWQIYP